MTKEQQEMLLDFFPAKDVEWRVQSEYSGKVLVLAYITARAVLDRLDAVFGIDGWEDSYEHIAGGVECSIGAYCADRKEWIHKVDGAPNTAVEAFKGGYSAALKRCAVKWGIGRYLYNMPMQYMPLLGSRPNGAYSSHKDKSGKWWYWSHPAIPAQWLPKGERGKAPDNDPAPPEVKKAEEAAPPLSAEAQMTVVRARIAKGISSLKNAGVAEKDIWYGFHEEIGWSKAEDIDGCSDQRTLDDMYEFVKDWYLRVKNAKN